MSLRRYGLDRIQAAGASVIADPQGDVQLNPASGRGVYVGGNQVFDDSGNLQAGSLPSHTHAASDVTSGTFTDARIAESSVTQHEAELSIGASQVTAGTFGSGAFTFPGTLDVTGAVTLDSTLGVVGQLSTQSLLQVGDGTNAFNFEADTSTVLSFRNATANSTTNLAVSPSGTADRSQIFCYGASDVGNTSFLRLDMDDGSAVATIQSWKTGSGTTRPISVKVAGTEAIGIDLSHNVSIPNGTLSSVEAATLDTGANGSSFGGDLDVGGFGAYSVQAGDPTTAANTAHVYAKDVSTSAEIFVQDEAGNTTQLSPHGPDGYWHFYHYSAARGQTQVIHVERLLRRLADRVGLNPDRFIYEFEGTMAEVGDPPSFDDSVPDTKVKRTIRRLNPLAA